MEKIYGIRIDGTQCTSCGTCKTFDATPRQYSGWQSVRFAGNRYVLLGGIRTNFFINLNSPIVKKASL